MKKLLFLLVIFLFSKIYAQEIFESVDGIGNAYIKVSYPHKSIIREINFIDSIFNEDEEGFLTKIEITYTNNQKQILEVQSIDKLSLIYIEDLNFDGYPDIRFLTASGVNASYAYFIYSPEQKTFNYSELLTHLIINPKVISDKRIIKGSSRDGCCSYKVTLLQEDEYNVFSFNYTNQKGFYYRYNLDGKILDTNIINEKKFDEILEM